MARTGRYLAPEHVARRRRSTWPRLTSGRQEGDSPGWSRNRPPGRLVIEEGEDVARYTLVYRDDDGQNEVTETLDNVDDVQREDGIVSFWRGNDAFLRLQEKHVVSLDET